MTCGGVRKGTKRDGKRKSETRKLPRQLLACLVVISIRPSRCPPPPARPAAYVRTCLPHVSTSHAHSVAILASISRALSLLSRFNPTLRPPIAVPSSHNTAQRPQLAPRRSTLRLTDKLTSNLLVTLRYAPCLPPPPCGSKSAVDPLRTAPQLTASGIQNSGSRRPARISSRSRCLPSRPPPSSWHALNASEPLSIRAKGLPLLLQAPVRAYSN